MTKRNIVVLSWLGILAIMMSYFGYKTIEFGERSFFNDNKNHIAYLGGAIGCGIICAGLIVSITVLLISYFKGKE